MKVPQDEKDGLLPILVIVDEKSGCVFSGVVAKGVNPHATGLVAEALQFCGCQKVIMMTDAEHRCVPLQVLLRAITRSPWGQRGTSFCGLCDTRVGLSCVFLCPVDRVRQFSDY